MLVANFALNRISNGLVLDTFGYGHVGVCTNTQIVTNHLDRFDSRMSFNGTSSQVSVASITCPQHFTIAVWLKRSVARSFYYETIVAFGNDTPFFGLYQGRPVLTNSLTTEEYIDTSWNHLAAMQDSKGSRIYLNGQRIGTSPSRARVDGHGMVIGCNPGRRNAWFRGEIACVALFDEALSEKDLINVMDRPIIPNTAPILVPKLETQVEPGFEIEEKPTFKVEAQSESSVAVVVAAPEPAPPQVAPVTVEKMISHTVLREQIARQWNFGCKFEFEGLTHVLDVSIASVETIEALHFEEEVTFAVEIFGKRLLLPIRHRTAVSTVDEYTQIFEEYASVELKKQATHSFRREFATRALDWLRDKVHID